MTTANITPTPTMEGTPYATNVPLVSTEADLGDGLKTPAPIAIAQGQTIVATVKLACQGHVTGQSCFVFLQTDLGDNNWVDLCWCTTKITDGSATFVLCGGGLGAMNNAFGPQRQQGSAPTTQANGSNACPLGGRCRFTGFGTSVGGSSSIAGTYAGVFATITYKLKTP